MTAVPEWPESRGSFSLAPASLSLTLVWSQFEALPNPPFGNSGLVNMPLPRPDNVEAGLPSLDKARRLAMAQMRGDQARGRPRAQRRPRVGGLRQGGQTSHRLAGITPPAEEGGRLRDFLVGEDFPISDPLAPALREPRRRGAAIATSVGGGTGLR